MANKITYKDSGVDVEAGYAAVKLMKKHVQRTFNRNVLSDIGGFGGLFSLDINGYKEPVLVSGTDGVGTKLKIAFMMDKHNTIGEDCVAMCINDILCQGAKPLFFLDYIATGKLEPNKVAEIVEGVANGCVKAGCALIGGETAEMPDFYSEGEYDIAGFAVGIVDKSKIIDGSKCKEGDVLIGLPSNGLHSNGFSLVRKIFFDTHKYTVNQYVEELGCQLGEELLKPTKIYADILCELVNKFNIKGISHITGGGFYENIPRMIPNGLKAYINTKTIEIPPIFNMIMKLGNLDTKEMYSTFNMGVGIVMVIDSNDADKLTELLKEKEHKYYLLGEVKKGEDGIELWHQ